MLDRKVVVITGASSGLGRELALQYAARGAVPVLLARRIDKLAELKALIRRKYGVQTDCFAVDLANTDEVRSVIGQIYERFERIDILINCAGFGKFEWLTDANIDEVKRMFAVNVIGLIACTKAVLPGMIKKGGGHIVNVASIAGKLATAKSTVYSATKHAVLGFSNGLRMELDGENIFVTTVNPGPIWTDFFRLADPKGAYLEKVGRFALRPETVAARVVRAIEHRKREVNMPWYMGWAAKCFQLCPGLVERLGGRWMKMK